MMAPGFSAATYTRLSVDNKQTPPRPAIFVAQAKDDAQAREIHKRFWNMGDCPFVLIVLRGAYTFIPVSITAVVIRSKSHR